MAYEYVVAGRRALPGGSRGKRWSFSFEIEGSRSEDGEDLDDDTEMFDDGSLQLDEVRRAGNATFFAFVEKHAGFSPKSVVTIRKASWGFSRAAAEVVASAVDGVCFVDALVVEHGLEPRVEPTEPATSLKELSGRIEAASREAPAFFARWAKADAKAQEDRDRKNPKDAALRQRENDWSDVGEAPNAPPEAPPKVETTAPRPAAKPPRRPTEHIDLQGIDSRVTAVLVAAQLDADGRAQRHVVPAHLVVALLEAGDGKAVMLARGVDAEPILATAKAAIEALPTIGKTGESELHRDTISLISRLKQLRSDAQSLAGAECLVRALAEKGHLPTSLRDGWTPEERSLDGEETSAVPTTRTTRWFPISAVQDLRRDLPSRVNAPVAPTEAKRLLRALERLADDDIPGLEIKATELRVELRSTKARSILLVEWRDASGLLELRLLGLRDSVVRQFHWDATLQNFVDPSGDVLSTLRELVLDMFPAA